MLEAVFKVTEDLGKYSNTGKGFRGGDTGGSYHFLCLEDGFMFREVLVIHDKVDLVAAAG
jgi:hypothetical protein